MRERHFTRSGDRYRTSLAADRPPPFGYLTGLLVPFPVMTANTVDAPVAKRTRRTKPTTKAAPPATEKAPTAKRTRKTAPAPVTVRKVALGVQDLAKSLYDDALERVGGNPKMLYRIKVLSPSRYELDMTRPRSAETSD